MNDTSPSAASSAEAPSLVVVHGHDKLVAGLESAARAGAPPQALLLAGPQGVGKRTVGRRMAQALLCTADAPRRPCGGCRACRLSAAGTHPDLHVVDPPLRIEAARALQSTLSLAPVEGAWRVALLPEIETASVGAANSLLKLLEEPPAHAVLVLSASAVEEVLPTIRSRARRMRLRPLAPSAAAAALEQGWQVEPAQAVQLARWSGGCLGAALALLADEDARSARELWLDHLEQVIGQATAARLALAASLSRDRDGLPAGLALWNGWWRDALLLGLGVEDGLVHPERRDALASAAATLGERRLVDAVRAVERALAALAAHANPQLTMEVLLLELPQLSIRSARAA